MSKVSTHPPDQKKDSWNDPEDYPPEDKHQRWATRRAQFLMQVYELSETPAYCIAWSELGYSNGGIAQELDLTESTVKKHREELEQQFGYCVGISRTEFSLDFRMEELPTVPAPYCPKCGERRVTNADRAESRNNQVAEKIQSAIDNKDATHVCLACGVHLTPVEA